MSILKARKIESTSDTLTIEADTIHFHTDNSIEFSDVIIEDAEVDSLRIADLNGTPGFVKNSDLGDLSGGHSLAASDIPTGIDAAKISTGAISNTEFDYLNGLSGNIQNQFDAISMQGYYNKLKILNNTGAPNTKMDVTATVMILTTAGGSSYVAKNVSVTINCATTGTNGLDTGSLANNTWYYIYLVSNGTTTVGMMSTSASVPSPLPSGYTYYRLVGAVRTTGAALLMSVIQYNNKVWYLSNTNKDVNSATDTSYAAATMNYIPPNITATVLGHLNVEQSAGGVGRASVSSTSTGSWMHRCCILNNAVAAHYGYTNFELPIASSQRIYYKKEAGDGGLINIYTMGYTLFI